jgi:hypothetical protein
MSKHKFIYTLILAIVLVIWMMVEVLGAAKAMPNDLIEPFSTTKATVTEHTIAGYYVGMSDTAAQKNCASHPKFNYEWVPNPDDPGLFGCFIDPAKIIPPRDFKAKATASAYKHLQVHPGFTLVQIRDNKVANMFFVYFEPEQWNKELALMADFELIRVFQRKHPNGVDYDVNVYYNESNDTTLNGWFWYSGIDFFPPFGPDEAHRYNPKDRMYVIDYAEIDNRR